MRSLFMLPLLLLPLNAFADDRPAEKNAVITVHGEATAKVAPDQVTLPVTVKAQNASLKMAKKRHDDQLRDLLKFAEDNGIAKDKTQTSYTAVNPVYNYEPGNSTPRLQGYEVVTSIDFTLTDMGKLADFMNGVINQGISQVGSVSYSLQDESKVKEDTLVAALGKAHDKAARLAAAANVGLGQALDIQEGDAEINPPMPQPMFRKGLVMAAMAPAPAPPELPSGMMEIRQSVTVTYQLQ